MNKPAFEDTTPIEKPAFEDTEDIPVPIQPSQTAVNISAAARPILEIGGAIGGSALGGGPELPTGIAGGIGGYALGKAGADLLSRKLGTMPPLQNIPQAAQETAGNLLQGGSFEAGGAAIGKGLGLAAKEANPMMQRALGFSKRFLMTKPAREAAADAAQVALENKVMPMLGSPVGAASNLETLKQASGKALGNVRESVGPQVIDPIFNSLETLRDKLTQGGAVGGEWDALHNTINDAQATIIGLQRTGTELGEVSLNKIVAAKKAITDGINYLRQNATQQTAKQIGGAIEDGIENILEAHGVDMGKYAALKRIYSGSSNALKALNNELAAQEGNQAINPMSIMLGTGQLAAGNPGASIATMGGAEFVKRRGTGIAANLMQKAGNSPLLQSLGLGLVNKYNQ